MIHFNNLSVKKGENLILKNIDLRIGTDENVAIVGPNGSGKSTLLDIIAGKVFPFQGKVTKPHFNEIELIPRDYGFSRIVGAAYQYYQQRYHAYDSEIGPTVYEVIQNQILPIGTVNLNSVELTAAIYERPKVEEMGVKMNILHLLERKVTSLSNGETRRTLIAIALLKKPKVLLLDCPFVGLDVESKASLMKLLDSLDLQIVLVAALNELPNRINKLICLEKGALVSIYQKPFPKLDFEIKELLIRENLWSDFKSTPTTEYTSAIKMVKAKVEYGDKVVLDGIDWEVKKGEKWALLGPNGSGKSTLLSLVTADNPQAYRNELYLFDKKRGSGETIWDIKRRIGYLSPEMHIYFPKNMTVWKVIASGLYDTIGLNKKPTEQDKLMVSKISDLLNIRTLKERKLNEISVGEQRMVLLARALIKNPEVLLLDEPCQNLDYSHMIYFRDLINSIAIKLHKTLIFVSHNLEEIPACVTKTLVLKEGKVSINNT
ncbi:MAG: molybdate transport system ATP-binding protein [Arcticibacterium sp.]|jgi:molybdate transport system ATP-binding protein